MLPACFASFVGVFIPLSVVFYHSLIILTRDLTQVFDFPTRIADWDIHSLGFFDLFLTLDTQSFVLQRQLLHCATRIIL